MNLNSVLIYGLHGKKYIVASVQNLNFEDSIFRIAKHIHTRASHVHEFVIDGEFGRELRADYIWK